MRTKSAVFNHSESLIQQRDRTKLHPIARLRTTITNAASQSPGPILLHPPRLSCFAYTSLFTGEILTCTLHLDPVISTEHHLHLSATDFSHLSIPYPCYAFPHSFTQPAIKHPSLITWDPPSLKPHCTLFAHKPTQTPFMPYPSTINPLAPSSPSPTRPRRMDSILFDYFDVCTVSALRPDNTSQSSPRVASSSKLSSVWQGFSTRVQSLLPRRLHEPTGPWGLILDMVLSLFVAQGACRSVINALPLEVVGKSCSQEGTDLESCGVRVPALQGDKCAICLGCYEEGDSVRHLVCSHAFHAEVRTII